MPNLLDLTTRLVSETFTRMVQYSNGYFFDGLGNKIPLQAKRGSYLELTAANNIIAEGEIVYETDTKKLKIGDGVSTYNALDYFTSSSSGGGGETPVINEAWNQELIGVKDGVNKTFTTNEDFIPTSTRVYVNGIRLKLGVTYDYTESGLDTIIFEEAPQSNDNIILDMSIYH